ncbi:MAG: HYR domain-containing protein, partial [FCB group bacterium]|nr:HYR domain-containing protein [FCB group bacterium]
GDTTVGSYPGLCGTAIGFEASATDNCYAATVYCHPPSGSFIPVGVKTVTCLAVDIAGNTDSTQFTITVEDTEPPELLLPEDITALNDPGQCGALVSYEVDVTDNCSGATMACSPVSGYYFEVGITSVTCIGLDTQGNADTGIFLITVVDTTPPVINCPSDMHVANFPDQCGAPVDFNIEAADNCSDVTVTTFPESGSFFEKGETPVKILAVDDAGNKDSCEFIISVHDYEPPQAICPEDM